MHWMTLSENKDLVFLNPSEAVHGEVRDGRLSGILDSHVSRNDEPWLQ